MSNGFEIETELVVHALQLNVSIQEIRGDYKARPGGSASKLATWSDGSKILRAILRLARQGRPLAFFGALGVLLALAGIVLGIPVLITFIHTHAVPRFPTAILATGLEILAAQSITAGLALDTVSRARREQQLLAFLAIPGPMLLSGGTMKYPSGLVLEESNEIANGEGREMPFATRLEPPDRDVLSMTNGTNGTNGNALRERAR